MCARRKADVRRGESERAPALSLVPARLGRVSLDVGGRVSSLLCAARSVIIRLCGDRSLCARLVVGLRGTALPRGEKRELIVKSLVEGEFACLLAWGLEI